MEAVQLRTPIVSATLHIPEPPPGPGRSRAPGVMPGIEGGSSLPAGRTETTRILSPAFLKSLAVAVICRSLSAEAMN